MRNVPDPDIYQLLRAHELCEEGSQDWDVIAWFWTASTSAAKNLFDLIVEHDED